MRIFLFLFANISIFYIEEANNNNLNKEFVFIEAIYLKFYKDISVYL
jgi:hypothetical protein